MSNHRSNGFRLPLAEWIWDYQKGWLRQDIIAGLTAAAVVIPMAMAHATIAGLPVQVGLYTAFLPMLIYAALGTSRPLSVSTTSTLAILAGAAIGEVARGRSAESPLAATATLTLLVGSMLLVAAVLRLGFVANFISEPVLIGFKAGIGLVIVFDQVPKLLGIHFPKGPFFYNLLSIARGIPDSSLATVAVGAVMVGMLVAIKTLLPRAPAPLMAVAAGIAGMSVFHLQAYGVHTVGQVPTGLPSITLPDFSLIEHLWPAAAGIALMNFAETIAAGRAFAATGERPLKPNRELVATGFANLGGALLGAMPAGGGTTQTAVNRLAGARSQLAGLVTGVAALATILLLAPFIGLMPEATLAAVVIVYSVGLIKLMEFRSILKVRRTEFVWAVVALAGVVALGTLKGILAAIVVSLVALAYQAADPPVHVLGRKPGTNVFRPRSKEHPEDDTFPGLLLLRPEGRIFFANAARLGDKMMALVAATKPKVVVIDFSSVFDLEYTALKRLSEGEARESKNGISIWLAALNPVVLGMVQRSPLGDVLGRDRMFFNLEQAVEKYLAR